MGGFGRQVIDIMYLPFDLARRECKGYAFINFKDSDNAAAFYTKFQNGRALFGRFFGKLCLSPAKRQGRAANLPKLCRVARNIKKPYFGPVGLTPGGNIYPLSAFGPEAF